MANIKTLTISVGPTNGTTNQTVSFADLSYLKMTNKGSNRINYELLSSTNKGHIDAGKSVPFPSYSGLFTENIQFTFLGTSELILEYVEGDSSTGNSNVTIVGDNVGLAKEAKQDTQIINQNTLITQQEYKQIGKFFDLSQDDSGDWQGFPFPWSQVVSFEIILDDGLISNGSELPDIFNITMLVDELNKMQADFVFSVYNDGNADTLLIQDGLLSVDRIQTIIIFSDNNLEYSTFTNTPDQIVSASDAILLQNIRNGSKQRQIISQMEDLLFAMTRIIRYLPASTVTVSFTNDNTVRDLGLPSNTIGELIEIKEYGTGFVTYTLDGSTPVNSTSAKVPTSNASFNPKRNIDLSLVRFKGSSTGSDYSVSYSIYNVQ